MLMTRVTNNDNGDPLEDVYDPNALSYDGCVCWSMLVCEWSELSTRNITFFHILWLFPQFLPGFWWFGNCAAAAPETGIFLTLCHIFGSLRHNLSLCPAQQLIHHLQHCQPVLKLKNREYKDEKYFFENCQN